MTIATVVCEAHRWFLPKGRDGITLAECMVCRARQYQPTDGTRQSAERANELNRQHGYPLLTVAVKRVYDKQVSPDGKKMVATINATELRPETRQQLGIDPPEKKVTTEDRLARLRDNKGKTLEYDKKAPQVLEDARHMSLKEAFAKHGIPNGSITRLIRRWRKKGWVPDGVQLGKSNNKEPVVRKPKSRKLRNKYPSKYDDRMPLIVEDLQTMRMADIERKHGMPVNSLSTIVKQWKKRGLLPADFKPFSRVKAVITTGTTSSDSDKKHHLAVDSDKKHHYASNSISLPVWNEAWGDSVKVEWLRTLALIGRQGDDNGS